MDHLEVIERLKREYPGKTIICLPEELPTEIICEVEPSSEHPDYSEAVAAIKSSMPHHHKLAVEKHEVIEGDLELTVDGDTVSLKEGDSYTVQPGQIHSATGNFTLVQVTSKPGWTPEDHILSERKTD